MEWVKHKHDHQRPPPLPQQEPHPRQPILEGPPLNGENSGGRQAAAAAAFEKVMTDEQIEILQKQIAAYATICEQLEILHRSLTSFAHNDPSPEFMLRSSISNPYCPPLMMNSNYPSHHHHHNFNQYYYGQPKFPRRQRWNPTSEQLNILEKIFDQGHGAPSKERIRDITAELAKHGQIAESNVYNWFQNRRARLKKRQTMSAISESSEEGEMASETSSKSNNGEKPKSSSEQPIVNGDGNFSKVVGICVDQDSVQQQQQQQQQPMFSMEDSLKASSTDEGGGGSFGQMGLALHGRTLSSKAILDCVGVNQESYPS